LPARRARPASVLVGEAKAREIAVGVEVPGDVDGDKDDDGDDGANERIPRQRMANQRGHESEPCQQPNRLQRKVCHVERHDGPPVGWCDVRWWYSTRSKSASATTLRAADAPHAPAQSPDSETPCAGKCLDDACGASAPSP